MNSGFKSFPKKLYGNTVKMLNVTARAFGMSKPTEIFYSVKDGLSNDITVWETVSGRVGRLPSANDDVYIRHYVTLGFSLTVYSNIFISNTGTLYFSASGKTIQVNGNLFSNGTIDMVTGGPPNNLILLGNKNNIGGKFIAGQSVVTYSRLDFQEVSNLPYYNLTINGSTLTKCFYNNPSLVITGQLTVMNTSWFELIQVQTLEIQKGISLSNGNFVPNFTNINLTTNSQSISIGGASIPFNIYGILTVVGSITVTNLNSTGFVYIYNALDGTMSGSSFVNQGKLYFGSTTNAMVTAGTFDKDTFNTNVVGYVYDGNATLQYTTYQGLYIAGTGIKTQATGTNTIATTLTIASGGTLTSGGNTTVGTTTTSGGILNLLTYDWTFTGASSFSGTLSKTGAGNILFIGVLSMAGPANATLLLSGNPTVEMRGGMTFGGYNLLTFTTGTGQWTFTTNNQSIICNANNANHTFTNPIVISGAITVTNTFTATVRYLQINHSITGDNVASTFVNQGAVYFNSTTPPMAIGVFTATASTNIVGYVLNGNYTLPYTSYQGLYIAGSGLKTLGGSTTISTTLKMVTPSNADGLELSTYDLTVTGASDIQGLLSKSGGGNILFIGAVSVSSVSGKWNFSGNPTVEIRNGLLGYIGFLTSSGTGQWTFSTNNQTVSNGGPWTFDCPILISGAITVTLTQTTYYTQFNNTVNGNNAASTLDNRQTGLGVYYQATTRPMVTGILQCNGAANTWKYDKAGNQDITGGTYRTLTLAGTGVKTLQGNVVVATTYTLTAPATLALNGFTRT